MDRITQSALRKRLREHRSWRRAEGGCKASFILADLRGRDLFGEDLSGVDFTGADLAGSSLSDCNLAGACLRGAVLKKAQMTRAILTGADLGNADLSSVNCSYADLRRARLVGASLTRTHLYRADMSGADLTGAVLSSADLNGADLTGANLSDTCLDPAIGIGLRRFCRECPPLRTGGRIVYRTEKSTLHPDIVYLPGHTYTAPWVSWSADAKCHPGIHAASWPVLEKYCPNMRKVKCYVRDGDWTITSKGFIRCRRLRVLKYVESLEQGQPV